MLQRISLAILVVLSVGLAAQTPTFEGTWRGTLDTGSGQLRLVLRVTRSADGLHTGQLESLDQGSTIPIDRITVTGASVRIEIKSVSGVFEGTLSTAGTELKGTWSQGAPLPLTFTRDAAAAPAASPTVSKPPPALPFGPPIDLKVPVPPTPFVGSDGKTYLVYEVHLSNFSALELLLTKFEVIDESTTLATFEGPDLNAILALAGGGATSDRRTLPAGRRAVAYVWLAVTGAPPSAIRHRVSVGNSAVEGARVSPGATRAIEIGPPLTGDNWLAANGPGPSSGHRRALISVEGCACIAQRFAIDWVRLNPSGAGTFTGDQKDNKSYRAYGAEILAVADGPVVAIKDGIPENIPGLTSRAVPITLETVGGNYVVLDLGGGRYAFYAHIQPGSLRVKVGDRVKRGQVIGLVGNSGNSTEPHLHFHVSNGLSPLGSEGLPYAVAGMTGMPLQNARVSFNR